MSYDKKNKWIKPNSFVCDDFHNAMLNIRPNSIDCIFTSPPYNVGKKYDSSDDNKKNTNNT